jgi:hypothetical protein
MGSGWGEDERWEVFRPLPPLALQELTQVKINLSWMVYCTAVAPAAPKRVLYGNVYVPVTVGWFAALQASPRKDELLAHAGDRGLLETLRLFDELCRGLVDPLVTDDMVAVAYELREAILWMDGDWAHIEDPGPDPSVAQISASLVAKLRRNISLGVLEAVLCLESACRYAQRELHLRGDELRRTLLGSRQLYAGLAVLHDKQERERLSFLTGIDGYLEYPAVDHHHILDGELCIPSDKFVALPTADGMRIRFVRNQVSRIDEAVDGPTMRCPAHRPSPADPDLTYNDILWNLLIEIYQRSGRFGRAPAPSLCGS